MAPGAKRIITPDMDDWLYDAVVNHHPPEFGYDMLLWSSIILAELLKKQYGVEVSSESVTLHLKTLGLSYQQP